jgi:hypothetical protein
MKKLILSALFIGTAATAVQAQSIANSVLVYGDLSYTTVKDAADNKTRNFDFNPGIGYQFNEYVAVGIMGSFGTNRTRLNNQTEWNFQNTYSAGVFVRGTMRFNKIFAMYHQLEAAYVGRSNGNTGNNTTLNANGFRASLTPAIAVYVHDGLALNFGFGGINFETMKNASTTLNPNPKSTNTFNLTWGTQFNIGVSKNIMCNRMHKRHHRGGMMNHGSKVEKEEMNDKDDE